MSSRARRVAALGSVRGAAMVKWKVEPVPGPALSTHIVPPISSASSLLMARPRPVPPYLRVVLLSAWLNFWNSRLLPCSLRPMPVSRTAKCSISPCSPCFRRHAQHHLAGFGELDRVAEQVEQDLAQPRDVAVDHRRHGSPSNT